jgi:hypothetical protein
MPFFVLPSRTTISRHWRSSERTTPTLLKCEGMFRLLILKGAANRYWPREG